MRVFMRLSQPDRRASVRYVPDQSVCIRRESVVIVGLAHDRQMIQDHIAMRAKPPLGSLILA